MAMKLATREEVQVEIGRLVRKHREAKKLSSGRKLSQARLAAEAGISHAMVGLIEQGGVLPGLDILYKIAKALGCHYTELVPEKALDSYSKIRDTLDKLRRQNTAA